MGFSHADVFPRVAATIERLSSPSQDYVLNRAIVDGLVLDSSLKQYFEQLARDAHYHSKIWWARCMVQWFSQVFTMGRSEYDPKFERKKIKGAWAYRVRIP
jgi:hypothetical protein